MNTTAIARRSVVPIGATRKSLEKLTSPDPEDKSGVEEGRRVKKLDGGYLVINYTAYRERDFSAAERMRRYRARLAELNTSYGVTLRNVTQVEEDVDVDVEADKAVANATGGQKPPKRSVAKYPENTTLVATKYLDWFNKAHQRRLSLTGDVLSAIHSALKDGAYEPEALYAAAIVSAMDHNGWYSEHSADYPLRWKGGQGGEAKKRHLPDLLTELELGAAAPEHVREAIRADEALYSWWKAKVQR